MATSVASATVLGFVPPDLAAATSDDWQFFATQIVAVEERDPGESAEAHRLVREAAAKAAGSKAPVGCALHALLAERYPRQRASLDRLLESSKLRCAPARAVTTAR